MQDEQANSHMDNKWALWEANKYGGFVSMDLQSESMYWIALVQFLYIILDRKLDFFFLTSKAGALPISLKEEKLHS